MIFSEDFRDLNRSFVSSTFYTLQANSAKTSQVRQGNYVTIENLNFELSRLRKTGLFIFK